MWQDQQVAHKFDLKERSSDVLISESVTFGELLLSDKVLSGLQKSGFYKPSPIQLKAIPLGRCGLDLIVQAKSGTGKTCVFAVIALDNVNASSSALQVIVLAPTREIALQIHGVISCIGQDIVCLSVQAFIGGTIIAEDRMKAKNCHIAIGSPGRIMHLIKLGILDTRNVRMFVLDEADKLLEEGSFQSQINYIYSSLPESKQLLALSATYPETLAEFLTRYMREPTFVRLDVTHPSLIGLRQYYLVVEDSKLPHILFEEKAKQVVNLLSNITFQQVLVFSNYHSRAESICEALNSTGWPSTFISGNMEQERRIDAINKLKQFQCRVLVSTDLTSRGIDAQNVDVVINMDVPSDWETYMHRIGRAGRFGSRGIAVSLVSAGDEEGKFLSLVAKCNAVVLPLNDITKEFGHRLNLKNDGGMLHVYRDEGNEEQKDDEVKTATVEQLSIYNGTKEPGSEHSATSVEFNQTPVDDFLYRVINESAEPPLIPSLRQLQSNTDHLRKNKHYLKMSYEDLKKDYEYFAKTGKFLDPPSFKSNSHVTSLTMELNKLSTNEVELSTTQTIDSNKDSSPQITQPNSVKEPINHSPTQNNNNSVTSNAQPCKQNERKSSSNNTKKKHFPTEKNRMQQLRKRHPNCAAAGLDSLKHWSNIEKANAACMKESKITSCNISTRDNVASSNTFVDNLMSDNPAEGQPRKVFSNSSSSKPFSTNKTNFFKSSKMPLSYEESSSESYESTSYDDDSSDSEISDDSAKLDYSYNASYITAPPVLLPFGPTGHCFNPYVCPHPNPAFSSESFFAHQAYHYAMDHARKQIFRFT